jgi:hypothetical protein
LAQFQETRCRRYHIRQAPKPLLSVAQRWSLKDLILSKRIFIALAILTMSTAQVAYFVSLQAEEL